MNTFDLPTPDELLTFVTRFESDFHGRRYGKKPSGDLFGFDPAAITPFALEQEGCALSELMALTGLDEVKAEVKRQLDFHLVMRRREALGMRVPERLLHLMLTGNPGCGKTTVARLIGRIYAEAGILSSSAFVEANRASLVGEYIGVTEKKTTELLEKAAGGILFIDEIYALRSDLTDNRDFGMRAIDTLMPVLSDPSCPVMVIGAGYPDEIRSFLSANPGLASRFPVTLHFPDFSEDELMDIAASHLSRYDFSITAEAASLLRELVLKMRGTKHFGNARSVITLLNNYAIPNLCSRLSGCGIDTMSAEMMSTIEAVDIPSLSLLIQTEAPARARVGF